MAYQPKFAAGGRDKTPPRVSRREPPKKEKSFVGVILTVMLTLLVVPASLWLTGKLILGIGENVGRPKASNVSGISDKTVLQDFEGFVEGALSEISPGQSLPEAPVAQPGETPPETEPEETKPPRKHYRLEDDVKVAPLPNQNYFGQTEDPGSLQWLLEEAADILEGQELFFSTEVQIFEGSKVMYYLDDSIFAVTWKEPREGSVYTFTEVKVSDASQFRRHLSDGEFGGDKQYVPTEMAQAVNAVVASSGDFYRFRNFGICVYEGKVRRVEGTYAETCMIDRKGDLHFVKGGEITTTEAAQAYVDENDIWFSLCFGPILVEDSQLVEHTWYGVGEINEDYARSALCQMDERHYVVAIANVEGPNHRQVPNVAAFGKQILSTGCKMAYCLDGGQTAAIVMNNQLINRPATGAQRQISDIIYFATAVPEGE